MRTSQPVPHVGDKIYLVQVCDASAHIIAGHVERLTSITSDTEPDAAEVRYAPDRASEFDQYRPLNPTDTEWLDDLAQTEAEARVLLACKIMHRVAHMRDSIAALEAIDTAAIDISDKTERP